MTTQPTLFSQRLTHLVRNVGGVTRASRLLGVSSQTIYMWQHGTFVPNSCTRAGAILLLGGISTPSDPSNFAERLRLLVSQRGGSGTCAGVLGVGPEIVRRWQRGVTVPSLVVQVGVVEILQSRTTPPRHAVLEEDDVV